MAYQLPARNPNWPMPRDYRTLNAVAQKEARQALLSGWYTQSRPRLITKPDVFVAAFQFFVNCFIKRSRCMTYPTNVFYENDCRWLPHWMQVITHPLVGIVAFRGASKTVWFVHLLSEFVAVCRPGTTIVISEYNATRTDEECGTIMNHLTENELLQAEFGRIPSDTRGTKTKKRWCAEQQDLTNGSQIRGVSINSAQRGRHPMLWINDDAEKDDEAKNPDWREDYIEKFWRVGMGMMRPGTHVINVGTYTNPVSCLMTCVKRLDERYNNWRTVECPLLVRQSRCDVCQFRSLDDIDVEQRVKCPNCEQDLTWDEGNASRIFGPNVISMWPEVYSVPDAELMVTAKGTEDGRVKALGKNAFWTEMMNKPQLGGDLMFNRKDSTHGFRVISTPEGRKVEMLQTAIRKMYDEWLDSLRVTGGVDVAYSLSEQADYSSCVITGFDPQGYCFLLDAWRGRVQQSGLIAQVRSMAVANNCKLVGWERTAHSVELVKTARAILSDVTYVVPLKHAAGESKALRITRLQVPMESERLLFPVFRKIDDHDPFNHKHGMHIQQLLLEIDRFTSKGKSGTGQDDLIDAYEMAVFVNQGARGTVLEAIDPRAEAIADLQKLGMPVDRGNLPRELWSDDMWLEARGHRRPDDQKVNARGLIW